MREMKDSKINRIGNIPAEWKRTRIKYLYSVIGSGTTPTSGNPKYYDDGQVFWIQSGDLYKTKFISDTEKKLTQNAVTVFSALKQYNADFLVIAMYGASIGNVSISKIDAVTNQACCAIIPKKNIDFNYMYYSLLNDRDIMIEQSIGGTQPNISQNKILELPILVPHLSEQQKIATYLDEKCDEIDALISELQQQIEVLEEYKRSVITETVTKGLNSNVKMKDSGVQWIGKIPKHWKISKGKYLFSLRNTRGNDIQLQLLSPTQRYGVIPQSLYEEVSGFSAVKLNDKTDFSTLKTIHKGDYCISLRSFQGGFEYSDYEGVVSPAYQVFYPIVNVCRGYYRYLFKTQVFIREMNSFTMSLRDGKNIAFEDFGKTYIPIPTIEEQFQIAESLNNKCKEIDITISEKQNQIKTIEEYKKSLIFEYVTGKKEII